ncbi:class I tRNA ligase family protein [Planctomyces sp. SH-PL14]|uniref:class I tRNA ligase family protein n=1 Tax=Planctomyces sp. SH-PL14 TaxID=1632864 RepID=UPI00078BEE7C|nr:class I tRNA ligase family protein [Planctomyces sp. SH-PL14]AMV19889.1 Isoleucine--tRNA ligase [Planctomyces sp. SH-PL14]
MFQRVDDPQFISGEHEVLRFWEQERIFDRLRKQNAGKPKWSFLDGPITANNPMGVHHAWGRTYKDAFQRYFAMTGRELRYQNGFDCQGLWVEVEVEKELKVGTKTGIADYGIDKFVWECKRRVLRFAARQTEQSVRLGYWMDWDNPTQLRALAEAVGTDRKVTITTPTGKPVTDQSERIVERLGNPEWGGSYFTFSTENNETIWTFLKKCFERGKVYRGHDVMPWSGRAGSAYSQMEIADGRKLTTHRSLFVRFPLLDRESESLLVWTTTPWTLTSNVAAAVNPELDYVRLKAKKDGAVYYFAKDNLEFKRLEKEFKEGFGRPEWSWPEGVPKLKTIAQLFKEQGGYEIDGTVKGAELVGLRYRGPFDDLPAQQMSGAEIVDREIGEAGASPELSAVQCHRVVDGGRDFKGNPMVTAGEGTGIVHIAPGCGDVDHTLGKQLGLVGIAPLGDDGTFGDGFGPFTGRNATDPKTVDLVIEQLKANGALVYVETYPHIYPFCWRTGDELVFRLVDEWFIDMDWRDEIKDVTRSITWLPDSIQGQEREVEWLTIMRDWMISKKRFWGLALPIWVDEVEDDQFQVFGSLAELKAWYDEHGGEGWEKFEGHTPHRPWIDAVLLKNPKTGNLMRRIEDVGNPWLDAGIVPFSTLNYNENYPADVLKWKDWFPADLVTECFPGQFRNWFYSLLSLATMMRHDEAQDPLEKRPFKTLLGHRLVMNEEGKPMHKSDGTAIWFEEAAEQLGVDTLRWLYLAQNPAQDLRFGTRHSQDGVTLETVDGPISQTKEGLPTCKVTSKPADDVRRQVLIPLWNSYAFFVNYARLDSFDPSLPPVPVKDRPEIDRWILSNLQALIATARTEFENFNSPGVTSAAAAFIDDLSNWYIRRNRRRFWKSRSEGASESATGQWDTDKLAAYQTLYEVLVTLTKVLAPCIPFMTERMYRNLTAGQKDAPSSVHLCGYPEPVSAVLDESLNHRTATAQRVVRMGHRLREEANQRVRQPLAELQYACGNPQDAANIAALADVIADELNVKKITAAANLDSLVHYSYKPNLKTVGPKFGKLLNAIKTALPTIDGKLLAPLRKGESVTLPIGGQEVTLAPEDVLVSTEQASDWAAADDAGIQIALSTALTPELEREGMARDVIRQVQQLRKDHDLEENERIEILWAAVDSDRYPEEVQAALDEWRETILAETRATAVVTQAEGAEKVVLVGVHEVRLGLKRA